MPDTATLDVAAAAAASAEPLYQGKAKRLYATATPGELLVTYTNRATAFNGEKTGAIDGKGPVNNRVSALLMAYLSEQGVATHLIRQVDADTQLVREVQIVPLEVIMRNRAWGSMVRRTGIEQGLVLDPPVVEFSLKDDDLGDPLVNRQHIRALGIADADRLNELEQLARRINRLLIDRFAAAGLELIDGKLEFGIAADGELLLADEISPDTCRLHDLADGRTLDKDRFRHDMGGESAAYDEVLARIEALEVTA